MKAAFHYVVRAKLICFEDHFKFSEFEKEFADKDPILAREKALKYFQNYIDVYLDYQDLKYTNDRDAREKLRALYDPEISNVDPEIDFANNFKFGIGVYMVIDKPIPDLKILIESPFIHGYGFDYMDPETQIYMLSDELEYYEQNNYNTKQYKTEIPFLSEIGWDDEDNRVTEPMLIEILKTPFDWGGYDKPLWWQNTETIKELSEQKSNSINGIISQGETGQVEFIPTLLFDSKIRNATISTKEKIAKTISAFLNSKGGILIIGVNSKREILGLENDFKLAGSKNAHKFFREEFDQILENYLSFTVTYKIEAEFIYIAGKEVFFVFVAPGKRPLFIKGPSGKEFYIRGEASSRKLTDVEEIANFCIDRFTVQ